MDPFAAGATHLPGSVREGLQRESRGLVADSDGVLLLLVVDGTAADGLAASHQPGAVGSDAASASRVLSPGLDSPSGIGTCSPYLASRSKMTNLGAVQMEMLLGTAGRSMSLSDAL
jgi:hypothetical protein